MSHQPDQGNALILKAIQEAPRIQTAGSSSLVAIAARALNPDLPLSREGIAKTLGLHPSVVVAILVTADIAGDTLSRQDLGREIFGQISLGGGRLRLTPRGRLTVALFCLEQVLLLDELFEGLLSETRTLARRALDQKSVDLLLRKELEERAIEFQRSRVVPVEKGVKEKLGVPVKETIRRRGSQVARALLHGLSEQAPSSDLCPTVAGETAATLAHGLGLEKATGFCVSLARELRNLPQDCAEPAPGNGS